MGEITLNGICTSGGEHVFRTTEIGTRECIKCGRVGDSEFSSSVNLEDFEQKKAPLSCKTNIHFYQKKGDGWYCMYCGKKKIKVK